jgi:hypothetical protein
MLPNFTQDTNIPLPTQGVHNEFASSITPEEPQKKDSINYDCLFSENFYQFFVF